MLAAYTRFRRSQPDIGTEILIPVTNPIEALNSKLRRTVRARGHFRECQEFCVSGGRSGYVAAALSP